MKLPDLLLLQNKEPKTYLQFAASQLQGIAPRQLDYFLNFNDECFIVTDGVGSALHGDVAAKLSAETAIWAYKLVRQRPYYWSEKKKFIKRIFRSTNLTLWKKRSEDEFDDLATTMDAVLVTERTFWFGHAGNGSIFHLRNSQLTKLTSDHVNKKGELTKYLGMKRLGLGPQIGSGKFYSGDYLLMVSNGVTKALSLQALESLLVSMDFTHRNPADMVAEILRKANSLDGTQNMTACLIRRI